MEKGNDVRNKLTIWSGVGILGFLIAFILFGLFLSDVSNDGISWSYYLDSSIKICIFSALCFLTDYAKSILSELRNK